MRKPCGPPLPWKYSAITATSMTRPPNRRVQQELHRGVAALGAAELPDEEVHRDEHRLEEDVEQEDVAGGEHPDHERLEHEHQREEVRGAARPSTSFQAASTQTGTSTADSATIVSAMPSTPSA